jgi:uncharacterized DUF497 family protein
MMLHENFEWDEDKARINLKKHGVSFDDAALVLADGDGDRSTLKNTTATIAREKIGT